MKYFWPLILIICVVLCELLKKTSHLVKEVTVTDMQATLETKAFKTFSTFPQAYWKSIHASYTQSDTFFAYLFILSLSVLKLAKKCILGLLINAAKLPNDVII